MATTQPKLQITAEDKTAAAFASLRSRLTGAQQQSGQLVQALAGIAPGLAAALSAAGVASLVRVTVNGVDALNDIADATGSSIENISALENVANRTGATLDDVGGILVKFNGVLKDVDSNAGAAEVLKQLGLNAEELRRMDPAQALLTTAQAFAKFEDGGTKARYMQELFGKSTRQAAAYIKDLADAGQLNSTVTAEQAAQAEAFNKQLYAMSTEGQAAARAIGSVLVPELTKLLSMFNALSRGPGLLAGGLEALKGNVFASATAGLDHYTAKLAELDDQAARLRSDTRPLIRANMEGELAKLAKQRAELEKFAAYYRGLMSAQNNAAGQTDPTELARRGRGTRLASLPELTVPKPAPTPKAASAAAVDLSIPQDLQDALKRLEGTDSAKVARLTDELQRLMDLQAGGSADPRLAQAIAAVRDELDQLDPATKAAAESQKELQGLLGETNTAKLYELQRMQELLTAAYADGRVEVTQYAEALGILQQRQDELAGKGKEVADKMSVFAEQAQRNIQDTLGDSLYASLTGNFDSIEQMWGQMLARMAAQALAAQLSEMLFGAAGPLGAIFGTVVSGGRAYGGSVNAGGLYQVNERGVAEMLSVGGRDYLLMGNQSGQVRANPSITSSGGNSTSISFAPVIQIDARTDQAQVAQLVGQAMAESRKQLYRELKASGRL
jgi:hypothetical protein